MRRLCRGTLAYLDQVQQGETLLPVYGRLLGGAKERALMMRARLHASPGAGPYCFYEVPSYEAKPRSTANDEARSVQSAETQALLVLCHSHTLRPSRKRLLLCSYAFSIVCFVATLRSHYRYRVLESCDRVQRS